MTRYEEIQAEHEYGLQCLAQPGAVLYDVKSILPLGAADGRL